MVHGLSQSEAVGKAARELSAALTVGDAAVVETAKARYRKALQEYTDPFKVKRNW